MKKALAKILKSCRVQPGTAVRLQDHDPAWSGDLAVDKKQRKKLAEECLSDDIEALVEAQERLYAANSWSLLLIFQAMDAAGKDSTIKHVMSGVNPQGCQVFSFKHPSAEELDHNYLWRYARCVPERGRIGIFNRSYYEEALVVRVHPEILSRQNLPRQLVTKTIWDDRFEDINAFEKHLVRNGTKVVKFFLNVSKDEQKKRFIERLEDPSKFYKFSSADIEERRFWPEYMKAYEDVLSKTSSQESPWYIVPADHKWVTRAIVASAIVDAIESLDLQYPKVAASEVAALKAQLRKLKGDGRARLSAASLRPN